MAPWKVDSQCSNVDRGQSTRLTINVLRGGRGSLLYGGGIGLLFICDPEGV